MQNTQVKSHKRKGRVVKSHSRSVKGAKTSGAGMSAEECKAKYDAMVTKYGEDSPQAKKLAMKMEGMETVEKESKKKYSGTPDQQKIKAMKATGVKRENKNPINKGFKKADMLKAVKKRKHSRGDYMRKNVEEELLTKESKANRLKKLDAKKAPKDSPKMLMAKKVKHYSGKRKDSGDGPGIKPKSVSRHDKMAELRAKKK